jgi:hypothetical protein
MVNMQRADATFGVRRQHASCVRNTAEESLVRARFFSPELAKQCVDRVFDRCYRDEGFSKNIIVVIFLKQMRRKILGFFRFLKLQKPASGSNLIINKTRN